MIKRLVGAVVTQESPELTTNPNRSQVEESGLDDVALGRRDILILMNCPVTREADMDKIPN
jgi:hypothetical protein